MLVAKSLFAASFVVEDIEVRGIKKISIGTVLNYLPINEGETMDDERSAETIRALFETGLFDDVSLLRDEDTLVVKVVERPAISKIEITGNKDITSEQLTEALKGIGLAEGRIFDRSLLDKVERELELQYFSQGKYAVKIKSVVTTLDDALSSIRARLPDVVVAVSPGCTSGLVIVTLKRLGKHAPVGRIAEPQ